MDEKPPLVVPTLTLWIAFTPKQYEDLQAGKELQPYADALGFDLRKGQEEVLEQQYVMDWSPTGFTERHDIAAEAGVSFSDDGISCSGGYEGSKVTFIGFPSDDIRSHAASASAQLHATELIAGYNADSAFGFARAGLQNDGIKQFWETGFWSDFLDPSKTYVSNFETSFKRPVDPVGELVDVHSHESAGLSVQKVKRIKQTATFMDHVKDMSVMSWRDQRDAEWQTAIFRWHAMLST
eukprot:s860_g21.t1